MTRKIRPVLFVLALTVGVASLVHAHMNLEKTSPEDGETLSSAPKHLQLWFTQDPDPAMSKLEVTGSGGAVEVAKPHTMGDSSLMAGIIGEITDGDYTVKWQTAGPDGHLQDGEFSFSVTGAQ